MNQLSPSKARIAESLVDAYWLLERVLELGWGPTPEHLAKDPNCDCDDCKLYRAIKE